MYVTSCLLKNIKNFEIGIHNAHVERSALQGQNVKTLTWSHRKIAA